LNKIDDLSPDDLLEAECMIRTQSPSIRFIELAYHAQLDERLVLGLRLNEARFLDRTYRFASKTSTNVLHQHRDVHDHSGLGPHEHGVMTHEHLHEHDSGWMSFVLHSHERQDSTELRTALVDITNTEQVLRIKGTVLLHGLEQPVLVQGVRSRIDIVAEEPVLTVHGRHPIRHDVQNVDHSHAHAHDPDHEHGNETGHYSQLIFIGYHLDRNKVVDMLNKHTRTHWQ
jgi:cobalamin biosynthesis protein CobW